MANRPQVKHGCRLLLLWLLLCSGGGFATEELDRRIEQAARYLVARQLPSGFFRYEFDFLAGSYAKGNNLVRQAGGAFSLAEYHVQHPQHRWATESVRLALDAFDGGSVDWRGGRLLTVAGLPERAKAGATALALLSALLVAGEQPDERLLRQIDGWLNGLLALQMEDGGFEAKPGSGTQSPYSNGEIWLVLAHYVERFPDHAAARAALLRADRHFIDFYGASPNIGFFHWGVMAASKRYLSTGDERFVRFAAAQIDDYIHRMRPEVKPHANSCYAVEGMLAGLDALSRHDGYVRLEQTLRKRAQAEMEKNRRLQILPGQRRLQFGAQRYLQAPEIADHAGAFLNGLYRPQVRVDATQHCLSAMLKEADAKPKARPRQVRGKARPPIAWQ